MSSSQEVIFSLESPVAEVKSPITLYRKTWDEHIIVSHPEVGHHLAAIASTVQAPGKVCESRSQPGSYLFIGASVVIPQFGAPLTVVVGTAGLETIVRTALFHRDPAAGRRVIYLSAGSGSETHHDQG